MKTLKKILLTILVLVMSLTLVSFNWEGELDPNDFGDWKITNVQPIVGKFFWIYVKNPDQTSLIKVVAILTDINFVLYKYRYFKYGEPYKYFFDDKQDKFVREYLTEEERKRCIKCHKKRAPKRVPEMEAKNLIGDFKNG
jgi:hypothetical protein